MIAARAPAAAGAKRLGVAQALTLGGELLRLGRVGRDGLDLGQLEAQQVEVALARALALGELGELALEPGRLGVGGPVAGSAFEVGVAGEPVEHLELSRRQRQPPVLVLAVEGEQSRAERPQVGGRRPSAPPTKALVRPDAPDPPPEGDLLGAIREPFAQLGELRVVEQAGREREDTLHPRLIGAGTNDLRARAPSQQQIERMGEDRLAGSGLPGDRVQSRVEAQLRPLDQEQVLDPQLEQHRRRF